MGIVRISDVTLQTVRPARGNQGVSAGTIADGKTVEYIAAPNYTHHFRSILPMLPLIRQYFVPRIEQKEMDLLFFGCNEGLEI